MLTGTLPLLPLRLAMMRWSTSLMMTRCLGRFLWELTAWPTLRRTFPPVLPNAVASLSPLIALPATLCVRAMGAKRRSLPSLLAVWRFPWLPRPSACLLLAATLLSRLFAREAALLAGMSSGALAIRESRVPLGRDLLLLRWLQWVCRPLALRGLRLIVLLRRRLRGPLLRPKALRLLADRPLLSGF